MLNQILKWSGIIAVHAVVVWVIATMADRAFWPIFAVALTVTIATKLGRYSTKKLFS